MNAATDKHLNCSGCEFLIRYDGEWECSDCVCFQGAVPEDPPCYQPSTRRVAHLFLVRNKGASDD